MRTLTRQPWKLFFILIFLLFGCETKMDISSVNYFKTSKPYAAEISKLVKQMTLEEKVHMLHGNSKFSSTGVERLGIPEMQYADGPLGVREELEKHTWQPAGLTNDSATFFPAGGGLSATWNVELAHQYGIGIGSEARARGKDVLLAPAINIMRTPLCGRTFEYLSEDPLLIKRLTVPFVKGIQEQDVAACVKHYAVNNQETLRGSIDVKVDERTLREVYLPAFKAATLEADAYSYMGAYNKFRGYYLCENEYMLNTLLKGEWNFEGIVISDWGAVHSTVPSITNGLDVEMGTNGPYSSWFMADSLIAAVKRGDVPESQIDQAVSRILWVMFNTKMIGPDSVNRASGELNSDRNKEIVYQVASESIVLLKNSEGILPLKTDQIKSLAVIGKNATKKQASGGFGAGVKAQEEITPLDGIIARFGDQVTITYAEGYSERYLDNLNRTFGRKINHEADPVLLEEAVKLASSTDAAVIFIGSNRIIESEAADRKDLKLPFGQEKLVAAVQEANPNTIVVIVAGAPFDLNEIDEVSSSIIWNWFNGSQGGNAIADVLFGTVNPSGKLPFTIPRKLEDSPAHATNSFPGDTIEVVYEEGILVGYRWFDTQNIEPHFAFGHGLSYSSFEFGEAITDKNTYREGEMIQLEIPVTNTSEIAGKEVIQVYVADPESTIPKPQKTLAAFKKVLINGGETAKIRVEIPVDEFRYYDVITRSWKLEPGAYQLVVGTSSRSIKSTTSVSVQ